MKLKALIRYNPNVPERHDLMYSTEYFIRSEDFEDTFKNEPEQLACLKNVLCELSVMAQEVERMCPGFKITIEKQT